MDYERLAKEAFGITGTLMVLALVGLAVEDGLARWFSFPGLVGLGGTFIIFFALVFAWLVWFYRRR